MSTRGNALNGSIARIVFSGAQVVTPTGLLRADVAVAGGVIVDIGHVDPLSADKLVDVRGLYLLPGLIDTHTHLREPGYPERETFATGTMSAAAGGVTTVIDMPTDSPPTSTARRLQRKIEQIQPHAYVDFALYGCAGVGSLNDIGELARAGVVGYKSFLSPPFIGVPESEAMCLPDDAALYRSLRNTSETGLPSVIHAENASICDFLRDELRGQGQSGPLAHCRARPAFTEEEAVNRVLTVAAAVKARVGIVHISTRGAVQAVRTAKANGQPVTAEACPHHLLLNESVMLELGPYAKINPPLRHESDRVAVWAGLLDGTIDYIGTDHAPYTVEDKDKGWVDIHTAPSGAHGIETVLRLLLTAVNEGHLTLRRLAEVTSRRAAEVFGLYPRKGVLQVGSDADIVVVDLEKRGTIARSDLHTLNPDAARLWDGKATIGQPVQTYVRGTLVMSEGKITGSPGQGQMIAPTMPNHARAV